MLAALTIAALAACRRAPAPESLSVVLVTLDTTRADRIGAYGGRAVPTPRLDGIAREGTLALDASSQVPLTLPSHATILTGRYPDAHGVRHNGVYRLRAEEETLAEHLKAAGFETAAFVGSYVLERGFGTEQGFDTYDDVDVDRFAGGRDQVFEAQRTADEVNARVAPWLAAHRGRRVFLWVHYYDPHEPYSPPEKAGRVLAGTGYDREISYVDACFGDLLDALAANGFRDRSLLVVAGDHGEGLGEHGEKTHGLLLYQGTLHVPLIFRSPGLIPAGRSIGGAVELADIAPTIVDYLGLPPLSRAQGTSLRRRIEGKDDGRLATAHAETLMPRLEFGWSALRMIRDARLKYIEAPRPELYDLRADPSESQDLAATDRDRAGEMADRLAAWSASTTDATAEAASRRALSPDEEARLRSLGYLTGSASGSASAGSPVDPKDAVRELAALDAARAKLDAGDAAGALSGVEPIVASNPRNHQAQITRVLALIRLPDLRRAEDAALQALSAVATDPSAPGVLASKARGLLASVYRLEGKNGEAERAYRQIVADDPADTLAEIDLVRLLIDERKLDEAAGHLSAIVARDPRNGMALAAAFRLAEARGDAAARLAAARALADAHAGDPPTLAAAAAILSDDGDDARAAACYEVIASGSDTPDPELLGKLGVALMRAGRLEDASRVLERCAAARPSDPRPLYCLGQIAEREGNARAARERYGQALAADPSYAKARQALARLESRNP